MPKSCARPTPSLIWGPVQERTAVELIATGTYDEILQQSRFADRPLSERGIAHSVAYARRTGNGRKIKLIGARAHNLKESTSPSRLACWFASPVFRDRESRRWYTTSCITRWPLKSSRSQVVRMRRLERMDGADWIDEVVLVDQSPIGRTPRSNPVTYIKAFDAIRELFAALPESEKRGYARRATFHSIFRAADAKYARATAR